MTPSTAGTGLDRITLEILWGRLISIADESAAALLRTSFSTIVRESNDEGSYRSVTVDAPLGRVIEERESTTIVGPGARVTMDKHLTLIIDLEEHR
jgi:N-methylhydantoinase B/oxoprolinase/acetone carboxylase alpha subunit